MTYFARLNQLLLIVGFIVGTNITFAQDIEPTTQTNQWVTAFFDSFNEDLSQGNLDDWMDNWSEEAERITPMGNAKGKAQIRELYVSLNERYEGMVQTIVGTIIEGRRASVELHTVGIHKATGIEVTMPNVAVLTFNEQGKVTSAHVYLDMKNIENQLTR